MNIFTVKILLLFCLGLTIIGCNAVKKVPKEKYLLTENKIFVNGEETELKKLYNYLVQKPNQKLFGAPLKLYFYNLSKENSDSIYIEKLKTKPSKKQFLTTLLSKKQVNRIAARKKDFNQWKQKTGEAPVIISNKKIEKSKKRLEAYFWNRGWFDVSSSHQIRVVDSAKATINYYINSETPYKTSNIGVQIDSKQVDSIYKKDFPNTLIAGKSYNTQELEEHRNRLTQRLRNKGFFDFEKEYIKFTADTIDKNHEVDLQLKVLNRKITTEDSTYSVPFTIKKIGKIKVFTDYHLRTKKKTIQDTAYHKGVQFLSYDKMRYKPKAIANALQFTPNSIYSDSLRTLTYNSINNLGVFKYPVINFTKDPENSELLMADILLTPRKKYALSVNFDLTTSTIQDFGIGVNAALNIRNVFRRAENFEIAVRSNFGASDDIADSENQFFNISEFGLDTKLNFPRILIPFGLNRFIKKSSAPRTSIKVSATSQQNIGLDKETVVGTFSYGWRPSIKKSFQFDLFNLQYIRNLNTNNYFNVYQSSYATLNGIAQNTDGIDPNLFNDAGNLIINGGTNQFIRNVLNNSGLVSNSDFSSVRSISERRKRLTENNLILSSSFSFIYDNRTNIYDESFFRIRTKIESAGNILSNIARLKNSEPDANNQLSLFNVPYSQFIKLETEIIKHWDLGSKNILAVRTFGGIAIPYDNSNSIPFTQSYFAGGSNDNRGWTAYGLGPGSSGGINDFNEANFKLAFNIEHRFNILGALNGAFFIDAGNIWNLLDEFDDDDTVTFNGVKDLAELGVGSGFGLRYDFSFFIFRLDTAFKIHNPALVSSERWFNNLGFNKAVFNIGINYPF